MDDLHLRAPYGDASVEMLKRRILSVSRPVNATYIQIAATLPNAGDAQKLAQHIAERAVELNNSLDDQTNIAEAEAPKKILEAATARRDRLESEATQLAKRGSLEALQKEYASSAEIRTEVGRDLALARANLANYMGELQAPAPVSPAGMTPSEAVNPKGNGNDVVESQSGWLQFQISAAKFRVRDLEEQERKLLGYLNEKSSALEGLQRERESLEAELKSARTDEEGARSRLSEIEVSAPFRGVRLKILDPGIVPQRPSFPNIPLNITVAFVGSIFMALGYLAVQFALERVRHKQESWRMMLQK
jgi:uncharacterized protein involved in exopolysaccharide biosynthesis